VILTFPITITDPDELFLAFSHTNLSVFVLKFSRCNFFVLRFWFLLINLCLDIVVGLCSL